MHSLVISRRTAAIVLAAAVKELFPGVILLGGQETSLGFYYDFVFSFAFQNHFLQMIEERMLQIKREKRPIEAVEMMPISAAALFEHQGQPDLAERAKEGSGLSLLFRMGEFYDLIEPPFTAHSGILPHFKLELESIDSEAIRIRAVAFDGEAALKDFLKKREAGDHLQWGKQLSLFQSVEQGYLWQPKGVELKERLIEWWRRQKNVLLLETPHNLSSDDRLQLHRSYAQKNKAATGEWFQESTDNVDPLGGLLDPCQYTTDRAVVALDGENLFEEVKYSLQLMMETSKILGFDDHLYVRLGEEGKSLLSILEERSLPYQSERVRGASIIELRTLDRFGREWAQARVSIEKDKKGRLFLVRSLFVSLERTIALLLERGEGMLPFWLMPEQVRVMAVAKDSAAFVQEILGAFQRCGVRISIDEQAGSLGKRMSEALRERVPYCIVIGEREKMSGTIAVREYPSSIKEGIALQDLIEKIVPLLPQ